MTKYLLSLILLLQSQPLFAGLKDLFKDERGKTDWQHISNWSSGTLILLLSIVAVNLFITRRHARKSNLELKAIRSDLELRVQERTATLDESNRLLQETNRLLEEEVARHRATADRLRQSESYISSILASMPLILIGLSKDEKITQWNKRAEDISGVKAENALGKDLWDVYPNITVSPEQINEARSTNSTVTIKHSQRGQYHFDITLYPLKDQTETGVVILIDDVTKKVLAENMLIQSDKMSSMGELASAMAHDISMPLQAIIFDLAVFQNLLASGSVNLADNQNGDANKSEKLRSLLADAADKGQHVASIVSNLQAFARGRSATKQPSNIIDVMEHTLELAGDVLSVPSRFRFTDIHIERHYEQDLPLIPCYVTELQQAFLSLFRHACDALGKTAHPERTPTIKIQISKFYEALWIKIHHNGIGLSSEEQMHLFEPFFSNSPPEDNYDPAKRLSFAYFIITEQHQGEMAVTSDVNVGTTFHMQLQL
jgi:PAS domain S-box-containing protein